MSIHLHRQPSRRQARPAPVTAAASDAEYLVPSAVDTPRRRKTQNDLMDAAFRVFVEKGIAAASIDELATEAGYTRGAFHSNFPSKEALFMAMLRREMRRECTAMDKHLGQVQLPPLGASAPTDALHAIADAVTSALFDEGRLYERVALYQEMRLLALHTEQYAEEYVDVTRQNRELLQQHMSRISNALAANLRLDATAAANRILALFTNELLDIAIRREAYPQAQERIRSLLVDIFTSMVNPTSEGTA